MNLFEARHIAVSHELNGSSIQLFSDLNFYLEENKVYDLVGPSGSGKSTLLRACALMMERDQGDFFLHGKSSAEFKPSVWRRKVCLVPQTPALVPGSVQDNLLLPWKLKIHAGETPPSQEELQKLLVHAELPDVELTRDVSQLSGGQTARIALLRVFATRPSVMLLDEVDAALDDESAAAIGRLTHALVHEGLTCLRIRHRAADGFASGTFEMNNNTLLYLDGKHGKQ